MTRSSRRMGSRLCGGYYPLLRSRGPPSSDPFVEPCGQTGTEPSTNIVLFPVRAVGAPSRTLGPAFRRALPP